MSISQEVNHPTDQQMLFEAAIPKPREAVDALDEPVAVNIDDRAEYLGAALDQIEHAYKLAGRIKSLHKAGNKPSIAKNPAEALQGSRRSMGSRMDIAKELFARGAGYTVLRNAEGVLPQEIQDDLDLKFIEFKIKYAGPGKTDARDNFKKSLHKSRQ